MELDQRVGTGSVSDLHNLMRTKTSMQLGLPAVRTLLALITVVACHESTNLAEPVPTTLALNPTTLTLKVADKGMLVASVIDQYGKPDTTHAVTFTTGNAAIARVTSSGEVTATGLGTTTITASVGSLSKQATIVTTADLTLGTSSLAACVGGGRQLDATLRDSHGDSIGGTIQYASADPAVATVSASGLVTGVATGSTTITATAGAQSKSVAVVVQDSPFGATVTPVSIAVPYGLALAKTGKLYVAQIRADQLGRIDLATLSYQGSTAVPGTPAHVAVNPAGTFAYTTNQTGATIGVVDLHSFSQVATIALTDGGFNLIMNAAGTRLYATTASGRLHVIDPATRTVLSSMAVGPAANGLAFSPNGATLYASSRDAGTVAAIDVATNTITAIYSVGGSPQRLAVSPDGTELYVATEGVGLGIVDLRNGTLSSVALPTGGYGVGLTPDAKQLFVTSPLAGTVTVIDRATRAIVRTIAGAGMPRNVAFQPGGCTAIVSDEMGRVLFIR
jgi:YVTN family beta-propeller protein